MNSDVNNKSGNNEIIKDSKLQKSGLFSNLPDGGVIKKANRITMIVNKKKVNKLVKN